LNSVLSGRFPGEKNKVHSSLGLASAASLATLSPGSSAQAFRAGVVFCRGSHEVSHAIFAAGRGAFRLPLHSNQLGFTYAKESFLVLTHEVLMLLGMRE